MTSLEIDGLSPEVPGFGQEAPRDAQSYTRGLMALMNMVFDDPRAYTITEKQSVSKQVEHRSEPDVSLGVVIGTKIDEFDISSGAEGIVQFSAMSVNNAIGRMTLTIEHRRIPYIDLREDPFTSLMIDFFRSHLTG